MRIVSPLPSGIASVLALRPLRAGLGALRAGLSIARAAGKKRAGCLPRVGRAATARRRPSGAASWA